jgi:hypothetical protein
MCQSMEMESIGPRSYRDAVSNYGVKISRVRGVDRQHTPWMYAAGRHAPHMGHLTRLTLDDPRRTVSAYMNASTTPPTECAS